MVEIEMTEQVTYRIQMSNAEFAALVLENPEGATAEQLRTLVEERPSSDYGVEDAEGLLDETIEKGFDAVNDRSWTISVGED